MTRTRFALILYFRMMAHKAACIHCQTIKTGYKNTADVKGNFHTSF